MSLRGYVPKHAPAPWTLLRASQHDSDKNATERKPKRTFVRRASKQRAKANPAYVKLSRELTHAARKRGDRCPVVSNIFTLRNAFKYGHPVSDKIVETHHIFGRGYGGRGPLLMDQRLFLLVSKQGHRWIDANKEEARMRGWLAPMGWYNRPVPQDAIVRRNQWGGVEVTLADGTIL